MYPHYLAILFCIALTPLLSCVVKAESANANIGPPTVIRLPHQWSSIQIALDEPNNIHAAFIFNKAIHYSAWDSKRHSWRDPFPISRNDAMTSVSDPRIAIHAAGRNAFIAWIQDKEIRSAVLMKKGDESFAIAEKHLTSAKNGMAEMPSVGFAKDGRLYASWIDHRSKGTVTQIKQFISQYLPQFLSSSLGNRAEFESADLWFGVSSDGGTTFVQERAINDMPVCECCEPSMLVMNPNRVVIAHRSTLQGIKEIRLLVSENGGESFRATQVSDDKWKFFGCPHSGPRLRSSGDGNSLSVQWYSNGVAKGAASTDGAVTFSLWPSLPNEVGQQFDHDISLGLVTVIGNDGRMFETNLHDESRSWKSSHYQLSKRDSTVDRIVSRAGMRLVFTREKP